MKKNKENRGKNGEDTLLDERIKDELSYMLFEDEENMDMDIEVGIIVQITEKSYTSKKDNYLGKRIFNGALNILRKVIGSFFTKEIANKSNVFLPMIVNPHEDV